MQDFIKYLKPTVDSVLSHMFKDSAKVSSKFVKQLSTKLCISLTKMIKNTSKRKWLGIIAEYRIYKLEKQVRQLSKQRDDLLSMLIKNGIIKK